MNANIFYDIHIIEKMIMEENSITEDEKDRIRGHFLCIKQILGVTDDK